MKTIEEVKKYLKNELSMKEEKMMWHYHVYKNTDNTFIKELAKESYNDYYKACSIIEKILHDIEG